MRCRSPHRPRLARPACIPQARLVECSNIMKTRPDLKFPGLLLLLVAAAHAQTVCRFELADQSDGASSGFIFSLLASADSNGNCQPASVMLRLDVGDGTTLHTLEAPFSFQTGVVYTATATVSTTGALQISLNGQSLGTAQHNFQPGPQGTLYASDGGNTGTGTPAYVITQISLQIANGSTTISLAPNGRIRYRSR